MSKRKKRSHQEARTTDNTGLTAGDAGPPSKRPKVAIVDFVDWRVLPNELWLLIMSMIRQWTLLSLVCHDWLELVRNHRKHHLAITGFKLRDHLGDYDTDTNDCMFDWVTNIPVDGVKYDLLAIISRRRTNLLTAAMVSNAHRILDYADHCIDWKEPSKFVIEAFPRIAANGHMEMAERVLGSLIFEKKYDPDTEDCDFISRFIDVIGDKPWLEHAIAFAIVDSAVKNRRRIVEWLVSRITYTMAWCTLGINAFFDKGLRHIRFLMSDFPRTMIVPENQEVVVFIVKELFSCPSIPLSDLRRDRDRCADRLPSCKKIIEAFDEILVVRRG